MSYPYDYNPWDDNYATNSNNTNNRSGQTAAGYSATDGYSNPMAQCSVPDDYQTAGQPYLYNDQQQQQPGGGQLQQEEGYPKQPEDGSAGPPPAESAFKSFLRAHVPLCGPVMDVTSAIHIPFLDTILKYVNRDLLVSKIFYFFFYSAFGSLFPLMGVYFKQLGMNPAQVGILTGVRPFIEIFSAPFWSSLAERFQKGKALLLFSLLSWIVFTYSLAHIRPPASACIAYNDKDFVLYTPYGNDDLRLYDASLFEKNEKTEDGNELYMGKPPSENDLEDKNKILASEENENDQGRRRRKRQVSTIKGQEQIDRPLLRSRYTYSVEAGDKDEGYESHLDLDIDLENDFDDRPIQSHLSGHDSGRSVLLPHDGASSVLSSSDGARDSLTSFFEPADDESQRIKSVVGENLDDGDDDDEMEQSYLKSLRYKREVAHPSSPDYTNGDEDPEVANNSHEASQEADSKVATEDIGEENEEEQEGGDEVRYNENEKGRKVSTARHGHKLGKNNSGETKTIIMATTTASSSPSSGQNENTINHMETNENGGSPVNKSRRIFKERHKTPPTHIVGMSPITIEFVNGYNKTRHNQLVTPMFSTIVYKLDDIKEVFFLLLLLISLGEFFSAPAITIADSITLGYLGENTDLYGRQRMFGSFGWAITLMLVGMALDNSTSISDHPCGPHQRERSYTVCFAIFSLLMGCAFLTATQFRFSYPARGKNGDPPSRASGGQALVTSTTDSNQVITTTIDGQTTTADNVDDMYASTQPRNIFNTAPPVNAPPPGQQSKEKFEFLDKWKSAVFAQRTRELPEWVNVFRQFKDPLNLTYLFITWFLGCGVGLVFTFLFWHLQDVGGTPTLFGICSVINHVSEILAYFFSSAFIKRYGHTKVLSVGLGCNVIRFLYVAFLSNPYYALPFELVQGITHAACFAACCSYISHASKPELRTSTQGVMQSLHHGIGRACGTLIGGFMINSIGSRASFCIYGLLSGCVLAGFLYVRKKASMIEDDEVKVDDNEALGGYGAPQGVPSALPGKIAQTVPAQDIDYQW